MDKCADLVPEHFRFVKGVVDSPDFSLNISREMLQHTRQLKVIAANLEKKIKAELLRLQKDDREKYETFWKAFGIQIKVGVVSDYGAHKDFPEGPAVFCSSKEGKLTTLAEYKARMPVDQPYIYYACGEDVEKLAKLPQAERILDKGYEIPTSPRSRISSSSTPWARVDEVAFKSVDDDDAPPETDEEKAALEQKAEENKPVLDFLKETLGDAIKGGPGVQDPEERRGVPHRRRPHHPGDGEVFPAGGPRERQKHEGPAGAGAQPRLRRPSPPSAGRWRATGTRPPGTRSSSTPRLSSSPACL